MAVSYDVFLNSVLPYAIDVSEPAAIDSIRTVCIDFCERTGIWQARGNTLSVVKGTAEYPISVPALDARHVRISRLYFDKRRLVPISEDGLANSSSLDTREQEGEPRQYFETPDGFIVFDMLPDRSIVGGVVYDQVLTPTQDSEEVGLDIVYEKYKSVIACGALARLFYTQGQPYYNPQASQERSRMYEMGVSAAKNFVNYGYGRGKLMVAQRPFVRGNKPWR